MAQREMLSNNVVELQDQVNRLRARENEFKSSITNQQLRFKEELQRLMGKLTAHKEGMEALERQNEQLMNDKEELMSALAQTRAEAQASEQERARLQEHADQLSAELSQTIKVWTGAMKQRDETIRQQAAALQNARASDSEFLLLPYDERLVDKRADESLSAIDIPDSSAKPFVAQLRVQVRTLRAELLASQVENRRLSAVCQALRKVTSSDTRSVDSFAETATANVAQRIAELQRHTPRSTDDVVTSSTDDSPRAEGKGMRLASLTAAKEGLFEAAAPTSPRSMRELNWKIVQYQSVIDTVTAERDEFRRMLQESVAVRAKTESDLADATALLLSARSSLVDNMSTPKPKPSLLRTKTVGSLRASPQSQNLESPRSPQMVDWEKEKTDLKAKIGQVQSQLEMAIHAAKMHEERAIINAERAENLFKQVAELKAFRDGAYKELEDKKHHAYELTSAFKQKESMANDLRTQLEGQHSTANRMKEAVLRCRKAALTMIMHRTRMRELQLSFHRWAYVNFRVKHAASRLALKRAAIMWMDKLPKVLEETAQRIVFSGWREFVTRRKHARRVVEKMMRWRVGNAWTQWVRAVHVDRLGVSYEGVIDGLRTRLADEVASTKQGAAEHIRELDAQLAESQQQAAVLAKELSTTRSALIAAQQAQLAASNREELLVSQAHLDAKHLQEAAEHLNTLQSEGTTLRQRCADLQQECKNQAEALQKHRETAELNATIASQQWVEQLSAAQQSLRDTLNERDNLRSKLNEAEHLAASLYALESSFGAARAGERAIRLNNGLSSGLEAEAGFQGDGQRLAGSQLLHLINAAKMREDVITSLQQQLVQAQAAREAARFEAVSVRKEKAALRDNVLPQTSAAGVAGAAQGLDGSVDREIYLADIATASLRADVAQSEITTLKSEYAKILAEKSHEVLRLQEIVDKLQQQYQTTQAELAEVNNLIPALQQQLHHFRGDVSSKQDIDTRFLMAAEAWKLEQTKLQAALQEASKRLEELTEENRELIAKNGELSEALDKVDDQTARIEALVQAELISQQSTPIEDLETLRKQLDSAVATSEQRQDRASALENECSMLRDSIFALQAQVAQAQHAVITQTSPRFENERQAALIAEQAAIISDQAGKAAAQHESMTLLEDQLARLRIENDAQQTELKTLRAAAATLQQHLRDSRAQLTDSSAIIIEQRTLIAERDSCCQASEQNLSELRSSTSSMVAELARLTQERDNIKAVALEEVQSLRSQLDATHTKYSEAATFSSTDKSRSEELLLKLRSQGDQVAAASVALKQLQSENANLIAALNDATAKLALANARPPDRPGSITGSPARSNNMSAADAAFEAAEAESTLASVREQLAAEKNARMQLNAQLISMRSDQVILGGKHAAAVARADELQLEITRMYEQTHAGSGASDASNAAALQQLQDELEGLRTQHAKVLDQLRDMENRALQAEARAVTSDAQQELLQLRVTTERQAKELTTVEASYKSRMSALETAANSVQPLLEESRRAAKDWGQRCSKLQQEAQHMRAKLAEQQDKLDEHVAVLNSREARMQELEQELARCEQDFRNHKAASAETERSLRSELSSYKDTVVGRTAKASSAPAPPILQVHRVASVLQPSGHPIAPDTAVPLVVHVSRASQDAGATAARQPVQMEGYPVAATPAPVPEAVDAIVSKSTTHNAFGIDNFVPPNLSS